MITAAVLICLSAAWFYRLGAYPLFDAPNDAQYAEVSREMLESHDWVTPQLNYVVFLNKPPLLYWLIAATDALFGVNELAARLPSAVATVITFWLLYAAGREFFGAEAGLLAVAVYAAMPSTVFEGRTVRPDAWLMGATLAALLAVVRALRSDGRRQRHAIWGLQIALAFGVMAKGIVGLLLPGFPIVVLALTERPNPLWRRLVNPLAWWPFLLLVVPWHAIASWRNSGFLWDYVIQQHFLFFFDRKVPRDSVPVGLGVFWVAFLMRTFPWTLFIPVTIWQAVRRLRSEPRRRLPYVVILAWVGGVLLFFSLATSRLEHYALPALPGVALLVADLFYRWPELSPGWQRALRFHLALLFGLLIVAGAVVPGTLRTNDWLAPAYELPHLALTYFSALAIATGAVLFLSRRRPRLLAPVVCAATMLCIPVIHDGLAAVAALNSSASVPAMISAATDGHSTVVFEAPIEYQSCAGLNYYLRRKIDILRPAGFVAPAYLHPYEDRLFIDREALNSLWERGPVVVVTDPTAPRSRSFNDLVPGPFTVLGRSGARLIISNDRP